MTKRLRAPACTLAFMGIAAMALAEAAMAGTVTQMSTDVSKSIDDGQMTTSTLSIPTGRPPVTDLDVVGVQVSAPGGMHNDKVLELFSPRVPDGIATLIPGCPSLGLNVTYDDQAPLAFAVPADCTATATRRPFGGTLRALLHEAPDSGKLDAGGSWRLEFRDNGGPGFTGPPATLSTWGLRLTYLPMTFTATARKQRLRKKLRLEVNCSSACAVQVSGNAKPLDLSLGEGEQQIKVPLKGKVRQRLEDGGKAKIGLGASNDLGDAIQRLVKVKVTG